MPAEDLKSLHEKIDGLVTRMTSLETTVTALIVKAASHDKILKWLKTAGILLLGVAFGTGAVRFEDVVKLLSGTPG